MFESFVKISVDNRTYYIDVSRLKDLNFIDGKLVNSSNSDILAVSSFNDGLTYPYLSCSRMQQCRYYYRESSYNYRGYNMVNSPYVYSGVNLGQYGYTTLISFLLIILLGLRVLFKR